MAEIVDELIGKHFFNFDPKSNSGESFYIRTDFFDNGDFQYTKNTECIYSNHTLVLNSYGNSAQFNLNSICITPEKLRKLADELEKEKEKAISFFKKTYNIQ